HFAFVQTLVLEDGLPLNAALKRSGYRAACYRPYRDGQKVRVAAVWRRDGVETEVAQGLTVAVLRRRDADLRKAGLVPLDVSLCAADGEDRYAAVWGRKDA